VQFGIDVDRVRADLDLEEEGGKYDSWGGYSVKTLDVYIAAVGELYKIQQTNGINTHPHWRGLPSKGL
jgi:hypothetical protein